MGGLLHRPPWLQSRREEKIGTFICGRAGLPGPVRTIWPGLFQKGDTLVPKWRQGGRMMLSSLTADRLLRYLRVGGSNTLIRAAYSERAQYGTLWELMDVRTIQPKL